MRQRFLITILVGIFAVSCASGATTPPAAPQIPAVSTANQSVDQAAREALGILRAIARLNDRTADTYLEAVRVAGSAIPPATDKEIRSAHIRVADKVIAAVNAIRGGLTQWDQLRAQLQPIVDEVNALSNLVTHVANSFGSGGWRGLVQTLVQMAGDLSSLNRAPTEWAALQGGAR